MEIDLEAAEYIDGLAERLLGMTLSETDPLVVAVDAAIRDDTTGIAFGSRDHLMDVDADYPDAPLFRPVCVLPRQTTPPEATLRATIQTVIPITASRAMLCEYTDTHTIFLDGFRHLFLFGRGIPESGKPLSQLHLRKLLQHYRRRFARDNRFVFLTCNMKMRHLAATGVSGL
jgi:hypothetical protein